MITLSEIIRALTNKTIRSNDLPITEAVIDSRKVIPGSLFIALPGEQTDGHKYINSAFKRGANFALISKDMPADEYRILDIRNIKEGKALKIPDAPFCIHVDDSLKAMQNIARYWRKKLPIRVIGITGSVGKSSRVAALDS